MKRSKYGMTALTRVCWSMISETHVRYGVTTLRHGSVRPFKSVSYTHLDVYKRQVAHGVHGLFARAEVLGNVLEFDQVNSSFIPKANKKAGSS